MEVLVVIPRLARVGPVQPPPGNAVPAWFVTSVAAVQLCGTDNRPTNAPRPGTADTFDDAVVLDPCPVLSFGLGTLAKRMLDLTASCVLLGMVGIPMLAVTVLVRLTTPGPALFRQVRLGQDQRPFVLYKFRTMYHGCGDEVHRRYVHSLLSEDNPPAAGPGGLYKLQGDARITKLGRVLRKLSIDEVPQLFRSVAEVVDLPDVTRAIARLVAD